MFFNNIFSQGPPDLENLVKNFFGKFNKDSFDNGKFNGKNFLLLPLKKILIAIISLILFVWFALGIYIIQPAEQGALLKFGRFSSIIESGLHWHEPVFSEVIKEDVERLNTVKLDKLMLTSEENIVHVSFAVQYKIKDLSNFLFKTNDTNRVLQQSLESAVRQVVGENKLEKILTTSRSQIAQNVHIELEKLLDKYETGIFINEIIMQPAKAPDEVKSSFDDVIKAREDRERLQNEAESYANKIIPLAKGKAQRAMDESMAYEQKVVLEAEGNVADFNKLLPAYKENPRVVKNQLYHYTMENIFDNRNYRQ